MDYSRCRKSQKIRYDRKYNTGKGISDDYFEKRHLDSAFGRFESRKALEVGFFSGRLSRYAINQGVDLYRTEYSSQLLECSERDFLLDWNNKTIDPRLGGQAFQIVFVLGHALSFSGNVESGLRYLIDLVDCDGELIFDVWSDEVPAPSKNCQRLSKVQLTDMCERLFLRDTFSISKGPIWYYTFPRLSKVVYRIIEKFPLLRLMVLRVETLIADCGLGLSNRYFVRVRKGS